MSYQARVVIDAAPEVVFPYLYEPDRLRLWLGGFVESRSQTPGPLRVGTRSTDVFTENGRTIEMETEVIELKPNRSLGVTVDNKMVFTEQRYELRPEGAGTVVEIDMEARGKGLTRLMGPFLGGMLRKRLDEDLARLKTAVESARP
jgi:uncharacterized protein YndB with AHSA1/START domain